MYRYKQLSLIKLLLYIFVLLSLSISGCNVFSTPRYKGEVKENFDGENFHNIDEDLDFGVWELIKWKLSSKPTEWVKFPQEINAPKPPDKVGNGVLRVTFINHATILLQFDSLNVITDPVWSERISPVTFAGPQRYREPGIKIEDLPKIDVVLISHNHYDHLDIDAVKFINEKFKPLFLVPLGNKILLEEEGITNVVEMDWWGENNMIKNHKITFVPAKHFSTRGLLDGNGTLWGGFVLETAGGPIYYSGDTGFGSHFQQIKDKFGRFRFSMLPIAPINPRWLMKYVHMCPEEAVKAHKIINSAVSLGIHFGTFHQGDDTQSEAVQKLKKEIIKNKISPKEFRILSQGGFCEIPALP